MDIKYIEKFPTPEEYNMLSEAVGWRSKEKSIIEEAFKNTLYSLCVFDEDKFIGFGRIIGDKTIFLYFHDIKVHPEYQHQGIGTEIMERLLKQVDEYKKVNPKIRTYLGAAKGKEGFYERFGFEVRPNGDVGAGMILYDKED